MALQLGISGGVPCPQLSEVYYRVRQHAHRIIGAQLELCQAIEVTLAKPQLGSSWA